MDPADPVPRLHDAADAVSVAVIALRQVPERFQTDCLRLILLLRLLETLHQAGHLVRGLGKTLLRVRPAALKIRLLLPGILPLPVLRLDFLIQRVRLGLQLQKPLRGLRRPHLDLLQQRLEALSPGRDLTTLVDGVDDRVFQILDLLVQDHDLFIRGNQLPLCLLGLFFRFLRLGVGLFSAFLLDGEFRLPYLPVRVDGLEPGLDVLRVGPLRVDLFAVDVDLSGQTSGLRGGLGYLVPESLDPVLQLPDCLLQILILSPQFRLAGLRLVRVALKDLFFILQIRKLRAAGIRFQKEQVQIVALLLFPEP